MKNSSILLVILLCFSSCYHVEKPEKPERLLTKDKMSYLILDLSIAAAAKGINKQLIEQNGIMPRDFVFKKHKIDSTTFAQNNAYYSYNLKDFEAIYKKVNDSLLVLKAIAQKNSYIKIDKVKLDKQKAKTELKAKLPEFDK